MKRIFAAVVAMMLAVAATLPAFAEDGVKASDEVNACETQKVEENVEGNENAAEVPLSSGKTETEDIDDIELMEQESSVYFKQDFSQWESSDLSNSSTGVGTISKHKLQPDSIDISVDGEAMKMIANGDTAEQGILITPVSSIGGKNVTFSFMLKKEAAVNGTSTTRNIYFLSTNDSDNGKYNVIKMDANGTLARSAASSDANLRLGDGSFTAPGTDSDGYYNLSVDFCLDEYNGNESWSAYLYDGNNKNQLFYEVHWSKEKFPNGLQGVWLMSYRDSAARNNGAVAPVIIKNPIIDEMKQKPDLFVQNISHSGGQLEAGEKNIQITFNKDVDSESLDGVLFTKADGTEISGGTYISLGESKNIVNVGFGRLEVGNYKLKITSELKTVDGKPAAETEYDYNVISEGDTPYISHDFTKWDSGNLSNASLGMGKIIQISEINEADCIDYSIEGNMLRMKPTGRSNVATVFMPNRDINDKDTIFTFKMKADEVTCSGDGYRYIGFYNGLAGSTARNVEFIKIDHSGTLSALSKMDPIKGAWKAPTVSKDDKCYYLKFRFTREVYNGVDCWGIYVYDLNTGSGELTYTCHFATSNTAAFPDGIKGITFGAYRNGASVNAGDDFSILVSEPLLVTDADNLKTTPIYVSGNGAQPDIEEITVIYDESINESLFTSSTISLKSDNKSIPFEFTVLPEERALNIKPMEYLEYGKSYVISVDYPTVADANFTTAERPVNIVDVSLSGTSATVTTNSAAISGTCTVILAMYKADGSVIGYKEKPLSPSITFTDLDASTEIVKVFAIEKQTDYTRKATEVFAYSAQ